MLKVTLDKSTGHLLLVNDVTRFSALLPPGDAIALAKFILQELGPDRVAAGIATNPGIITASREIVHPLASPVPLTITGR